MSFRVCFPLVVASLLLATAAHAQLGIKGGINFAEVKASSDQETSFKTYFHAGLLYDWHVAGPLAIQPELLYSLQGGTLKNTLNDYETKLHYVALPVLARVTVGPVFVEAGPQIGLLLGATKDGRVQASPASTQRNGSVLATGDYRKADVAVCLGAGLHLGRSLAIGGRFVGGLTDINQMPDFGIVRDPSLQNRVVQLYASLEFGED